MFLNKLLPVIDTLSKLCYDNLTEIFSF